MKRLLPGCAGLVLLLTPAAVPAGPADDAEQVLRQSEYFVLGTLGRGGGSSPQTRALRQLLAAPDAVARCEKLLASGQPALRAYGLAGLKFARSPKFAEQARVAATWPGTVPMITGDVARQVSFAEFLQRLERDYPELPPESEPVVR
ncbi:MAG: hypothetical protein JSR82_04445 [Verrucomicrobia bacterium]|nr:hypothetical protein [Verrucomicrobiota bacterium]